MSKHFTLNINKLSYRYDQSTENGRIKLALTHRIINESLDHHWSPINDKSGVKMKKMYPSNAGYKHQDYDQKLCMPLPYYLESRAVRMIIYAM